jgi:hypothetical protein
MNGKVLDSQNVVVLAFLFVGLAGPIYAFLLEWGLRKKRGVGK